MINTYNQVQTMQKRCSSHNYSKDSKKICKEMIRRSKSQAIVLLCKLVYVQDTLSYKTL